MNDSRLNALAQSLDAEIVCAHSQKLQLNEPIEGNHVSEQLTVSGSVKSADFNGNGDIASLKLPGHRNRTPYLPLGSLHKLNVPLLRVLDDEAKFFWRIFFS